MKVLLFTLEYPPFFGGIANYYYNLVKYWPEPDNIFILDNNDNKLINTNLPFFKWLPSIRQLWKAIKDISLVDTGGRVDFKKSPPDKGSNGGFHIIVGHILPLGTAAYIVTRFTKTPYSVILHGMDLTYALRSGRKKWLTKKILKNASHIICASSFTAEMAKSAIGKKYAEKIKVVNPGVELHIIHNMEYVTHLRKKYNLENKIVLFSLGRLVKRKGFDKVIEAMPDVLKEVPHLVYVIAGAGPDEEYLKSVVETRQCLVSTNVIFLGQITDEEKWVWLNLCDIFIMPARVINSDSAARAGLLTREPPSILNHSTDAAGDGSRSSRSPDPRAILDFKPSRKVAGETPAPAAGLDFEGFGIVYLEANLAGKPVIAGRSGGVRDAVEHSVSGLIVDPESMTEIANAIIKLAQDEELRKRLGEIGRERAKEKFNWEGRANKIYNIITHNL